MAYDLVDTADELDKYRQTFWLSPVQWAKCTIAAPLAWQQVPFKKSERPRVPRTRGLYAFVIRPSISALFEHGYLMYVGQTGHGSGGTLQTRFDHYFDPKRNRKRPQIARLMQKWQDHLVFYFVPLANIPDLKALEKTLNDAALPPSVTADYSPAISEAVRAFP
jgi:hypothetical protein